MTNGNRIFLKAILLAAALLLASGCGSGGSAAGINRATDDSSGSSSAPPGGETAPGSVTLSWTAPTYNSDGSVITDLDGYRIYWGEIFGQYPNSVTIDNESITVYVLDNIPAGTYEFVVTSFNTLGVESRFSNPARKEVQ